ncbi:hypothetical protein WA538_004069, partial [Blastocystis sp. DL]
MEKAATQSDEKVNPSDEKGHNETKAPCEPSELGSSEKVDGDGFQTPDFRYRSASADSVQYVRRKSPDTDPSPHLRSPYSPILRTHLNHLRLRSQYCPYKRPLTRPSITPPPFQSTLDPFFTVYNEYMMVEPLPPTRRRSFSFGGLPRNRVSPSMRLVSFPQLSPKRASDNPRQRSRSKSMEKPSLRSGSHRTQPFHLRLVFNTVSRDVEFVGSSLEDLRYLINSSFSYLPVVRVCIEHPSIPNHMVPITDMDQLYDNAVVFLIPATS